MRTILRTFTRQIVAGLRQSRLAVVGTVDVRDDNRLRMRDFYQHAITAAAGLFAALERSPKPAVALAHTGHAASLTGHASSGMVAQAPRCWQPKTARQCPSARRS